jgi:predicted RNase H-like HicB family nuclease
VLLLLNDASRASFKSECAIGSYIVPVYRCMTAFGEMLDQTPSYDGDTILIVTGLIMSHFIGIVHKGHDTDYSICFPDFPSCISAGSTIEELMAMAHEALQAHIDIMQEYDNLLPDEPMSYEDVLTHEFAEDASFFIAVAARLPTKSKRINITMDAHLLSDIANVSSNRSAFLAEAARAYLRQLNRV